MYPSVYCCFIYNSQDMERTYMSNDRQMVKKMRLTQTMGKYPATERNEIGSFAETWMDLESVIQNEVSLKEKSKYPTLIHIRGI